MAVSNSKPNGGVLLALIWSIVVPAVSGAVTATVGIFSVRDQTLRAVELVRADEVTARHGDLAHYVTQEQWLDWRQQERARQDEQYYNLLRSVGRLEDKLKH